MNNVELLKGVKVLELATFIAAPIAARVLADYGAEVIKVESLGGDPLRFTGPDRLMPMDQEELVTCDMENANKKGIALNLKSQEGKKVFNALIDECDIFVTNLRTQALVKLGIDYESLSKRKPSIVFGQVLGYGEKGPLKDKPGFDFTAYLARGGWTGTLYEKGTAPLNGVPGMGDHPTGMYLVSGMLAAYINALKTGKGDKVTVSLYHAAVFGLACMVPSAQYGNHYPISKKNMTNPLITTYLTSDDRWIQLAIPPYDLLFGKVAATIGRPELAEDERFSSMENLMKGNSTTLNGLISEAIGSKDLEFWTKAFDEADLPFEVCQTWDEILEDEQAWANDILYKEQYPAGERINVRTPVMFKNCGLPPYAKGPRIGEHTGEILESLGYDKEKVETMKGNKEVR